MSCEAIEANINPCHKVKGAEPIGTGVDSSVYRLGDLVVKNYEVNSERYAPFKLSFESLRDYYELTNLASRLSLDKPFRLHFPLSKVEYSLVVNPFDRMGKCDSCGGVEGVSPYVPGDSLEFSKEFDQKELKIALRNMNFALEDKFPFYGINIIPLNVKKLGDNKLIVTDLCADICMLRKKVKSAGCVL